MERREECVGTGAGRRTYFAASNGAGGFCNRYEACFRDRAEQLYIIQGGPGTGKSRLMWDAVTAAERRGWQAELYDCSSDPNSLDAVFLWHTDGRSLILLDGTAPHSMQLRRPGTREHLIDLGAFWSKQLLQEQQERIDALMEQKRRAYSVAYRYLHAAGDCMENQLELLQPAVHIDALRSLAARLVSGALTGRAAAESGMVRAVCIDAVSMRGRCHLDTFEAQAERICVLERFYGLELLLMRALYEQGLRRGARMTVSYHPVFTERPDALFFEDSRVAMVIGDRARTLPQSCYHRTVKLRRLTDASILREQREALREAQRQRDALLRLGESALASAAAPHFALEELYGRAMDFAAKEAFTEQLCHTLFGA